MKITDGNRMLEVEMKVWDHENLGCDISHDYFGNFSDIRYDNEPGCESVALVHDMDDIFSLLDDWQSEDVAEDEEHLVYISDVTEDSAENLACVMRHSGIWQEDHIVALCRFAGMEDEYENCDDDEAEQVVAKAAEKLDVTIDWDGQNL